jgi:hypothetical protein
MAKSAKVINHRLRLVPHPDPTAPSAGAPRLPKISTQLKNTLATFARSAVMRMGATLPIA